ncbi:MAG TPA: DUF1573 domain-containing protein [Ferruginibacter sp.]|nr:DUF1573 domain-containing protein [Ferruginibacter sp.]
MKQLLFSFLALVFSTSLMAQKTADNIAKFKSETIDLGKLKVGNPTTATFYVSNIGSEPLIIEQANPTCGCTISNYTKEPIAVGKSGEINATYNAAGLGTFEKHLTVKFAGTNDIKSITIKGEVLSAEDFAKLSGNKTTTETTVNKDGDVKTKTEVRTPAGKKVKKTKTKTSVAAVKS